MERDFGNRPEVVREASRRGEARIKLRELAQNVDLCSMNMAQIGKEIGVTRERARQILPPDFAQQHKEFLHLQDLGRLRGFIEDHPEAVLTKSRGGMHFKEIAVQINVTKGLVRHLWQELELPDRGLLKKSSRELRHDDYLRRRKEVNEGSKRWRREHPEKARQISFKAEKKYKNKILREEHCQHCSKEFNWTQGNENSLRGGKRKYITCGPRCSYLLGIERGDRKPLSKKRKSE